MTSSLPKDTRITARLPQSVKDTLQKAADLTGSSLNQFLIQSAVKEAQSIIADSQVIHLTRQDSDKIFRLLENPSAPNSRLMRAIQRHQEFFSEAN